MKRFYLTDKETEDLKDSLLSFIRRVSCGMDNSPGEAQVLPEIVKLLLESDCGIE